MALPSGGHVEIDGVPYMIAEDIGSDTSLIRPHYIHTGPSVLASRTNVSGAPGKENLRPDKPLWSLTDFSGGEGLQVVTDPTTEGNRYDNGLCNPRYPGQLAGVPTRTDSNVVPTANKPPILVNAVGNIWLCEGLQTWYSSDGSTWNVQANGSTAPRTRITQAVGGSDALYIVTEQTPGSTSSGEWRQVQVGSNAQFVAPGTFGTVYGLAYLNGLIYSWATNNVPATPTRALKSYDTTAVFPVTGSAPLYTTGPANVGTNLYSGACTSENSVILMEADDSTTRIHEYKAGAGSLIWNMPVGFSGRAVAVSLGVVYVAGVYTGGFAALFGMSLVDRIPQFIGYIGRTAGVSYVPTTACAGPGDQVLIGMASGEIFIYSEAADGVSQLDVRSGFTNLASVATYKTKRVAAWEDDGGSKVQMSYWATDVATTTTSGTCITPAWDLGFPEEPKALMGYPIQFAPITSSSSATITISYQINEDGTYHALPVIDKNTAGASTGQVYLQVSDDGSVAKGQAGTVLFGKLRTKIVVANGAIVYAATARCGLLGYEEQWEIVIQCKDQKAQVGRPRPLKAWQLRDNILGNGLPVTDPRYDPGILKRYVTFKDGYRYYGQKPGKTPGPPNYTQHVVSTELVGDIIQEKGQSNMRLLLKSVAAP